MLHLAIKLGALGSFIGGPLYVFDHWKGSLGNPLAFALAFPPVGALALAALVLWEDDAHSRWTQASAWLGVTAVVALTSLNGFVGTRLLQGAHHPNAGMIGFGIAVGTVTSAVFLSRAASVVRT
jgi:hypothetical protein